MFGRMARPSGLPLQIAERRITWQRTVSNQSRFKTYQSIAKGFAGATAPIGQGSFMANRFGAGLNAAANGAKTMRRAPVVA